MKINVIDGTRVDSSAIADCLARKLKHFTSSSSEDKLVLDQAAR
jgi:hypothetical protein